MCKLDKLSEWRVSHYYFIIIAIINHESVIYSKMRYYFRDMSDDLLAREKEFHRLNRDLQLRTRDVMKTVDSIIHAGAGENLFSDANRSLPNLEDVKIACLENTVPRIDKLKTSSIKVSKAPSVECTDDTEISKKDNNVGNKAVITLLRGKIDMLYKKLQAMQLEYNNKVIL